MFLKRALTLPLLVIVWFLIKLGQLPLFVVLKLALILHFSFTKSAKFLTFIPKLFKKEQQREIKIEQEITKEAIELSENITEEVEYIEKDAKSFSQKIQINFIGKHKKRGRPRTQPLAKFYLGKFKRGLNKIFPAPLRLGFGLLVIAALLFSYSYFLVSIAHDLPSPDRLNTLQGPLTTFFYSRDGTLLYKLYEGRNRSLVKLEELPPYLVNATVAIEDKNYFNHPGVDFFAILRAFIANLEGDKLQGGSTITQQLIKNTLLTTDRTVDRKVKEVLLAYWTERIYSKNQILQMYFNEVPYGGTAWGVEAAAETYFDKKAKDLNLAESAFLAGLPASPTNYSPYGSNPELSKTRQKEVLRRMTEDGYISTEMADQAFAQDLNFNPPKSEILAPHFVMYVRSALAQKYGEKIVSQGGLSVVTTIDLETQAIAEEIVAGEVTKLAPLKVTNGAAMVTEAKTGHILAMVGSKDYFDPQSGNYNVTLALRQPGSSIKPITYATAFKQGYSPGTILLDSPTVFKNAWETYAPVNYDGKFRGPLSIRSALGESRNVPAVKMLATVGLPSMLQTAKDLGITSLSDPNRYGLALTLGGGEVRLIDMMTVYGTFSQNGVKHQTTGILKVTDSKGEVLEDNYKVTNEQVIQPGIAYMITDILKDNNARTPAFGPNSLLNIPNHQVAVKTGTTDSKRDNWTFGYTPEVVVGVWVGNNDNSPMDQQLTSGVTGASPIWNRIMLSLLEGRQPVAFMKPADLAEISIDGKRDLTLSGVTQKSIVGKKTKKIQEDGKEEKEVITFTDPFSTYSSDQTGVIKRP